MNSSNDKIVLDTIFNPFFPDGEADPDQFFDINDQADPPELKNAENEGIQKAENGCIAESIEIFTQIIKMNPDRAATYNNRAQALRLASRDPEAKADLNKAIELSQGKGRTGTQALCQRALIHMKQGNEEEALIDFRKAAEGGNQFAKMHLVNSNPYAALCNKMMTEMMKKLYGPGTHN